MQETAFDNVRKFDEQKNKSNENTISEKANISGEISGGVQGEVEGRDTGKKIREREKAKNPDTRPKGWLSIEEHLPMMYAIDIMQGYTLYKVKDKDGNEFESGVSDHNVWYYMAKEAGITHWWNGE